MAKIEEKVTAYWPIVVAVIVAAMWLAGLRSDVDANASDIKSLKTDHDLLIETKQRIDDIADHFNIPRREPPYARRP